MDIQAHPKQTETGKKSGGIVQDRKGNMDEGKGSAKPEDRKPKPDDKGKKK